MKKSKLMTLNLLVLAPMVLASCGTKTSSSKITACIASEPTTIDPALNSSVDGGTYDEHLFEGLYRWSYSGDYPDGEVQLVPGLAKEAPVEKANADGTYTYTYTLRDGLKWSDGTSLTASDIVRSWKRACSSEVASDYGYLYEAVAGGYNAENGLASDGKTEDKTGSALQVSAPDAKTFVATLVTKISYWNELTAFPAFAPVPSTADKDGNWCTSSNVSTFVCNGPMKIKAFDATKIEFVPNENYYNTSMVKAQDVVFAFSADADAMLTSYKSGSYDFIDDVPVAQIDTLKTNYPKEYFNVGQLGTYYACFNVNASISPKLDTEPKRQEFRHALCLLINRQSIIDNVAKGGQQPANGFVSAGLTGPNGVGDWTDKNGPDQDGKGWYDPTSTAQSANEEQAVTILKGLGFTQGSDGKFTDIPAFEYLYNTSNGHQKIAEAVQAMYSRYGITITLKNEEWNTFLTTRKNGEFTMARNGWLADYNDPISYLDMWTSGSGNDDVQLGKDANATYAGYSVDLGDGNGVVTGKTWAESYDVLIKKIKGTEDVATRFTLMHNAETELMSTWTICPIYYYTDLFMKKENLKGYFSMPLGYKFFYGCTK